MGSFWGDERSNAEVEGHLASHWVSRAFQLGSNGFHYVVDKGRVYLKLEPRVSTRVLSRRRDCSCSCHNGGQRHLVPCCEAMLAGYVPELTSEVYEWISNFPDADEVRMNELLMPALEKLGYRRFDWPKGERSPKENLLNGMKVVTYVSDGGLYGFPTDRIEFVNNKRIIAALYI
jgi:hypothetical protein